MLLNAFTSLSVQNRQKETLYADKRRVRFDIPTALNTLRANKVVTNKVCMKRKSSTIAYLFIHKIHIQVSSPSNLTVSADDVLLRGMGDVSLEGQSVNFNAALGVMLQSQRVRTSFTKKTCNCYFCSF